MELIENVDGMRKRACSYAAARFNESLFGWVNLTVEEQSDALNAVRIIMWEHSTMIVWEHHDALLLAILRFQK